MSYLIIAAWSEADFVPLKLAGDGQYRVCQLSSWLVPDAPEGICHTAISLLHVRVTILLKTKNFKIVLATTLEYRSHFLAGLLLYSADLRSIKRLLHLLNGTKPRSSFCSSSTSSVVTQLPPMQTVHAHSNPNAFLLISPHKYSLLALPRAL